MVWYFPIDIIIYAREVFAAKIKSCCLLRLNCKDPGWEDLPCIIIRRGWNFCRSWSFWSALFFPLIRHYLRWSTLWTAKGFFPSENIINTKESSSVSLLEKHHQLIKLKFEQTNKRFCKKAHNFFFFLLSGWPRTIQIAKGILIILKQ